MCDATFNLVEVDLGLTNLVVDPVQLWAGESATISWSGSNRTGVPLVGNWIDAVYLSTDDKWDIHDTLLATVPHTGGLAENQSYSGSATLSSPAHFPETTTSLSAPMLPTRSERRRRPTTAQLLGRFH